MGNDAGATVMIVGSVNVDLTVFSSRFPKPGETIQGDSFAMVPGGKGANQAVAAGRAGASTVMVGCVGDDVFADVVRENLITSGVDASHVHTVPGPTGVAHIRVDHAGENTIVIVPLANALLSVSHIDTAFEALKNDVSVLLTQLEIPWELTRHAIHKANAHGARVVLDPAPATALDRAIWPLVDIVTPNETEASILSGITVNDQESAIEAARWFITQGVGAVAMTLGSAGCLYVTADSTRVIPPHRVDVVDTTAAGDAFAGYFGANLAAGLTPERALEVANAAGALTVTAPGASPAIPHHQAVHNLLQTRPD